MPDPIAKYTKFSATWSGIQTKVSLSSGKKELNFQQKLSSSWNVTALINTELLFSHKGQYNVLYNL
jgi:hypothetical protein